MIYQQQTAAEDAPATKVATAAAPGLSLFCFCAAVAETAVSEDAAMAVEVTAAASSGFSCFCAAAVETAAGAASAASANVCSDNVNHPFARRAVVQCAAALL